MNSLRTSKQRVKIGFQGIVNSVDEDLVDFAYAKKAFNVSFDKGILTSNIGIDKAQGFLSETTRFDLPVMASSKQIKNVFHYRYYNAGAIDHKIIAQLTDGTFWQTKLLSQAGWVQIAGLSVLGDVEGINYRFDGEDIMLFASENAPLAYLKGDVVTMLSDAPHFASIEVYNERVFGCVNGANTRLWFSDDFNPANWEVSSEGAGYIDFVDECGDLLKAVAFLGHLYVFRDYGIFRLIGYGDQSTFTLKRVFTDTGRIYKHTIVNAGDKILFLADEGLFAFDGYDVVRIAKELPDLDDKEYAVGAYFDKKYFLACKADVDAQYEFEEDVANSVIVLDLFDKSISMLAGVSVCALVSAKTHFGGEVICAFKTAYTNRLGALSKSGKIFTNNLKKKYVSPRLDMGVAAFKTVRFLSVKTSYDLTLKVVLDGTAYAFDVEGKDAPQQVVVEKAGKTIGFEISTEEQNLNVRPIVAVIDVMQE